MSRLLVLVLVLLLGACMAGHKSAAPAPATSGMTSMQPQGSPHDEIEQLSRQIEAQRDQMQLVVGPPVERFDFPTPYAQDQSCHPATNATCTQSCTLSDDICKNAEKICDLAKDLAGDSWADGKCKDAKTTCKAAREKCCDCA